MRSMRPLSMSTLPPDLPTGSNSGLARRSASALRSFMREALWGLRSLPRRSTLSMETDNAGRRLCNYGRPRCITAFGPVSLHRKLFAYLSPPCLQGGLDSFFQMDSRGIFCVCNRIDLCYNIQSHSGLFEERNVE